MRQMKNTQASTRPSCTATVRSKITVVSEGAEQDGAVGRLKRRRRANSCHSPMFQATNIRMPASAASGTFRASGAATSITASSVAGVHHAGHRRAPAGCAHW
jgi:hypothetical protein